MFGEIAIEKMKRYKITFNKPFATGNEYKYIASSVQSGKISGNGLFTKKCQKFFENKYQKSYEAFEKEIKNAKEEDFEKWDNYLEWKAYKKIQSKYYEEKEDIENGNFKIKIV